MSASGPDFEFCANCPERDKRDLIRRYTDSEIKRFACAGPLGEYVVNGQLAAADKSRIFPVCGVKTYNPDNPSEFILGGVKLHITRRQPVH